MGRLRAALLVGATVIGLTFITIAERSGVFLSGDMPLDKFKSFLAALGAELDGAVAPAWRFLRERLETYIACHRLTVTICRNKKRILPLLRVQPRHPIKQVLALTQLAFLRRDFGFHLPNDLAGWLDELGSPEDISSIASMLIALANEHRPLDSLDFAFPLGGDVAPKEVRELMEYGKASCQRHEAAKDISLFGYQLEVLDSASSTVFYLRPPFEAFEYALRLGFIRSEMGATGIRATGKNRPSIPRFSMMTAAEGFATGNYERLCQIRDDGTEFRRVRLNFPMSPELYNALNKIEFYDDVIYREQLSQDFLLPLGRKEETTLQLTDKLDLQTFHRIWRYMQFMSLVDISVLRPFAESERTTLFNSLVRVTKEQAILELIKSVGLSEEEAREFLRLVSADVWRLGYFDLQYRPWLRIAQTTIPKGSITTAPEIIHLPALVSVSNVLRNVQSANQLRLAANADIFVELVAGTLRTRFGKVAINRRVESKHGNTDIDVVVFEGTALYIFECKHSVPPTGPHEMRDIWEEIEKGTRQLHVAIEAFRNPKRLCSYLAGWFPGTTKEESLGLRIVPCVLCSHRIFAGMEYREVPIRDFPSLARLCGDGIIGMGGQDEEGEYLMQRYRLTAEGGLSAADLDDYLSTNSKFFRTFRRFMYPTSRFEKLGNLTLARETYVYGVVLEEWVKNLEALGCARQPDERMIWTRPSALEDLLSNTKSSEPSH